MNIGILTLQSGYNYGGSLQCEALQEVLTGLGHHVSVINYYPVCVKSVPFWRGWGLKGKGRLTRIKRRWYQLRYLKAYEGKYNQYKSKHLNLTDKCHAPEEVSAVCANFDVLIVGSDQVWNLAYHPDPVYYLQYPERFEGKKMSYAACCGRKVDDAPEWVSRCLKELDAIAVRNEFTKEWVQVITGGGGSSVNVVADPTLLHTFELKNLKGEKPKKYIFVYIIGEGQKKFHQEVIRRAKAKHGDIPVILALATGYKIQLFDWVDEKLWMLDPYDWISWIQHASFVYTDSFHGILFSIKHKRDFLSYYTEAIRSPRLLSLANDYDLSDRIIEMGKEVDLRGEIDWSSVNEKIKNQRKVSIQYLESQLI